MSQSMRDCEALMRTGSRSFFAASRLLPEQLRAPSAALYAFCRVADDEVDEHEACPEVMEALHDRVAAIYRGQPGEALSDRAFAEVVQAYRLPRELPLALLEGFAWDSQGRRYETIDEVYDYGARVAGTVGAMMALIMGVREPWAIARACELGVAMQLTNIARDVGEDQRLGRLYLPRQWMREEGLCPDEWLRSGGYCEALGRVVARLIDAAEVLYGRAQQGVLALPRLCRPAILSARHIYADIGRVIEQQGYDSVNQRAVVSSQQKLVRIAQSLPAVVFAPGWLRGHKPLAAVEFLVEAALPAAAAIPPRTVSEKAGWMIDLLLTLNEREQSQVQGTQQLSRH